MAIDLVICISQFQRDESRVENCIGEICICIYCIVYFVEGIEDGKWRLLKKVLVFAGKSEEVLSPDVRCVEMCCSAVLAWLLVEEFLVRG